MEIDGYDMYKGSIFDDKSNWSKKNEWYSYIDNKASKGKCSQKCNRDSKCKAFHMLRYQNTGQPIQQVCHFMEDYDTNALYNKYPLSRFYVKKQKAKTKSRSRKSHNKKFPDYRMTYEGNSYVLKKIVEGFGHRRHSILPTILIIVLMVFIIRRLRR